MSIIVAPPIFHSAKNTYKWKGIPVPEPQRGWQRFGHYPSQCPFHKCHINLAIRSSKCQGSIDISIEKDSEMAAPVDLTLKIPMSQVDTTITIGNWEKSYTFTDVSTLSVARHVLLTIECVITWKAPLPVTPGIGGFLFNSSLSDVTIIVGEAELPAHKLILSANSSVLEAMFSTDMREAQENRVVVEDINEHAMKRFLSFLYTGTYDPTDNTDVLLGLLYAAEKYDVINLKRACELQLSDKLSFENVLKIVDMADTYRSDVLKECCLEFMVKNNPEITTIPEFDSLCMTKPHIMLRFIKEVSSAKKLSY